MSCEEGPSKLPVPPNLMGPSAPPGRGSHADRIGGQRLFCASRAGATCVAPAIVHVSSLPGSSPARAPLGLALGFGAFARRPGSTNQPADSAFNAMWRHGVVRVDRREDAGV
jgi:hypothetical protein